MTPVDRLSTLFEAHYADLVRLAAVLLDDNGACEEATQEAFANLLDAVPGPAPGKEAQYLRSAVLNGARSRLRRRLVRNRNLTPAPPPHPGADHEAVYRVEMQRVLLAVRDLPTRQAEVLALRYQADLTEVEIAETLGITPGSVKTHASRGLATLRERLGGNQ